MSNKHLKKNFPCIQQLQVKKLQSYKPSHPFVFWTEFSINFTGNSECCGTKQIDHILHGLHSYQPQKWSGAINVQNFAMKPLTCS